MPERNQPAFGGSVFGKKDWLSFRRRWSQLRMKLTGVVLIIEKVRNIRSGGRYNE